MPADPIVSVVIPVLNESRTMRGCLDALMAQTGAPSHEVIVVDNGSTDATPDIVRGHPIGARLLRAPARREVFDRVGPFDPSLDESGDVEFGRRATESGFRLEYCPAAEVLHDPATTLRQTWALHRRLGAGFSQLARRGLRGRPWKDPALL